VHNRSACQDRDIVVTLGVRFVPDEPIEIGHESRYFRRRRGYEPVRFPPRRAGPYAPTGTRLITPENVSSPSDR
jgi:hypothetical protein